MDARTTSPIPVASRIGGFVYAIRNIVTEARKVEASGRRVRYLNIGDPITFGFETPPHLIEAVDRAMRTGQNGYAPSVGILSAREAVAAECDRRGMPVSPDRVVITSGTSEGIELALTALAEKFPGQYLHQKHVADALAQRGLHDAAIAHYRALLPQVADEHVEPSATS